MSAALLFQENWRHWTDGWTDGLGT